MATKTAGTNENEQTREETADTPLIDATGGAVKKLLARGKEQGYVTYDELNAALPPEEVSSEQIEDTMTTLSELGINVVDGDEADDSSSDDEAKEDTEFNLASNFNEDEDLGRTDDPVRMYLREMAAWSFCRARARLRSPSASKPAARR